MITSRKWRRGNALVVALVFVPIMVLSGWALLNSTEAHVRLSRLEVTRFRAELAADNALNRLMSSPDAVTVSAWRTYSFGEGEGAAVKVDPLKNGDWRALAVGRVERPQCVYRSKLDVEIVRGDDGRLHIVSFRRS